MKTFSQFLTETVDGEYSNLNGKLFEATEGFFSSPEEAFGNVKAVMLEYGIEIPDIVSLQEEEVFAIDGLNENASDLNLYFKTEKDPEIEMYEAFAIITDTEGLDSLYEEDDDMDYYCITPSLLIRLMEYSRETIKEDITIHTIVEKMNELQEDDKVFTADDYDQLIK